MKLSLIIPAYNEEKNLEVTCHKLRAYLETKPFSFEIIVVEDGSNDATREILKRLENGLIKAIYFKDNQGKGAAVKAGMARASGDLALFMDADNSTDLREIDHFLELIDSGYDLVIGSRALKDSIITIRQPLWKEILGKLGNRIIKLMTGLKFKDTQCGFKIFNRQAKTLFDDLKNTSWAFDVELLLKAQKRGLRVKEQPIIWQNDPDSKFSLKCYLKFLWELVKIKLNNL